MSFALLVFHRPARGRSGRAGRGRRAAPGSVYIEDQLNQLQQSVTVLTGQLGSCNILASSSRSRWRRCRPIMNIAWSTMEKGGGRSAAGGCAAAQLPRQRRPLGAEPRRQAAAPPGAGADQLARRTSRRLQARARTATTAARRARLQGVPAKQSQAYAGRQRAILAGRGLLRAARVQNAMTAFAEGYTRSTRASPKGPDNLLKLGVTWRCSAASRCCAVFNGSSSSPPQCGGGSAKHRNRLVITAGYAQPTRCR